MVSEHSETYGPIPETLKDFSKINKRFPGLRKPLKVSEKSEPLPEIENL
jgi:hypothetical protein